MGRHKYYLLHASKSLAAFRAMKEAIANTRRHRPANYLPDLLPTARASDPKTAEGIAAHFAGRDVRWSADRDDGTVRGYLMDRTDLCPDEFAAVKDMLIQRGFAVKSNGKLARPGRFVFPAR
jgi:hypothetical protein